MRSNKLVSGMILGSVDGTMRSLWLVLMTLCLNGTSWAGSPLDNLPDPTRPSGVLENGGGMPAQQGFVLQGTTVSPRQRVAVINGQRLTVGERIDGATVSSIQPFQVTLQRAGRDITLRLLPPLAKEKR